eukprot:4804262-Amphidinium_carterae.4
MKAHLKQTDFDLDKVTAEDLHGNGQADNSQITWLTKALLLTVLLNQMLPSCDGLTLLTKSFTFGVWLDQNSVRDVTKNLWFCCPGSQ